MKKQRWVWRKRGEIEERGEEIWEKGGKQKKILIYDVDMTFGIKLTCHQTTLLKKNDMSST